MMKTTITLFVCLFSAGAMAKTRDTETAPAPSIVQTAIEKGVTGRVQITNYRPSVAPSCALNRAETKETLQGSQRAFVKLYGALPSGAPCQGWAWMRVQVFRAVYVTAHPVKDGDALEGALTKDERELIPGHTPIDFIPSGSTAAHFLKAGQMVETDMLRTGGFEPGQAITVLVRAGGLTVEQQGRVASCERGHVCATLPSGKRVEGVFEEGHLLVELQ